MAGRLSGKIAIVSGGATGMGGAASSLFAAEGASVVMAARRKEALEAFPLDALRMVGTIGSGPGMVALVLAPDKVTYRVRKDNYLGQSDGRVASVSPDRIEIVELVSDGAGGWLERQAALALDEK